MADVSSTQAAPAVTTRLTARALLLGERIDTAGLERSDVIATTPLAFKVGPHGYAVLFRYGVAVLIGLSPVEEDDFVRGLGTRIVGRFDRVEDETASSRSRRMPTSRSCPAARSPCATSRRRASS